MIEFLAITHAYLEYSNGDTAANSTPSTASISLYPVDKFWTWPLGYVTDVLIQLPLILTTILESVCTGLPSKNIK